MKPITARKLFLPLLAATMIASPAIIAQFSKAETVAPVQATGSMAIDLPDSSAKSVTLDIVDGRFSDYSVGRITLTGNGIDFRNGTLQGLKADVLAGDFDNIPVDKLTINAPAFSFNTLELLNNRTFILNQPVQGKVHLTISEANLNRFISNPKTLGKIEQAITKKTGGIRLLSFSNPHVDLMPGANIKLNVDGTVAQGLVVPLEMTGKMNLVGGQLKISGMTLSTGGSALPVPVNVASVFENRLNEMFDFKKLGKNSMTIIGDTLKSTGDILIIEGHATLTKLKFG